MSNSAMWLIVMLLIAVLVEGFALITLTFSQSDREDGSYDVLREIKGVKENPGAISEERVEELEDVVKDLVRQLEGRKQDIKEMKLRLHLLERVAEGDT